MEPLPEDITLECTDTYVLVPAEATDNCATPSALGRWTRWGRHEGVYSLVFDFTAVDDCDNLIEHQHVVTVQDTRLP